MVPAPVPQSPRPVPRPRPRAAPCPYCGVISEAAAGGSRNPALGPAAGPAGANHGPERCPSCRGLLDPLSRQASQNSMGPWFIRDDSNPFRPGCSIDTLRRLAARARIGPDTIIRGPTTRQFWMFARNTPGVANLFGECHSCHTHVNAEDAACHACGADFGVSDDRQNLGLGPVHLLPGHAPPETIAAASSEPARKAGDPRAALLLLVAGIAATLLLGFASAGDAAWIGSPARFSADAINTSPSATPETRDADQLAVAVAPLPDDGKKPPSETASAALASFDFQREQNDLVERA